MSNTIGSICAGAPNLISGNGNGVQISDTDATGNVVIGNLIGTDVSGTIALGNNSSGVVILFSPDNTIGGTASGAGNVISASVGDGVYIQGTDATGNLLHGNWIGTDVTGTIAMGNSEGVVIYYARNNTIGGTDAGRET